MKPKNSFSLQYKKKHYLCAMKNVIDISCFLSGKRLEMRMFDGFSGWVRLAEQTVDSCGYGLETCAYLGVGCKFKNRVKVK